MDNKAATAKMKRILAFIMREYDKCGFSYQKFADNAGISKGSLYRWAVGENTPNVLTVIKALDALGYELAIRRKQDENSKND